MVEPFPARSSRVFWQRGPLRKLSRASRAVLPSPRRGRWDVAGTQKFIVATSGVIVGYYTNWGVGLFA
eukprot:63592-Lingulodinium_polyedra.AAC.1